MMSLFLICQLQNPVFSHWFLMTIHVELHTRNYIPVLCLIYKQIYHKDNGTPKIAKQKTIYYY